ncbi:hypothetical protein CPB84DRAFT_1777368 [Gymnopilus junonius]|uniref:Uncharacterized protein n=1 Tax=Gymnopilus junonius TaxID=109634 RepID=A0A9P5NRF6_GYMJU|nr:hypothetical protein CPB84DRAFT_1777368 [Gymnopilus junonius]
MTSPQTLSSQWIVREFLVVACVSYMIVNLFYYLNWSGLHLSSLISQIYLFGIVCATTALFFLSIGLVHAIICRLPSNSNARGGDE